MPKAKAVATKALARDPNLAEAHTSMAIVKLFYDWDWHGAEAEFKRAVELNPNYPTAHHGYAVLLMIVYGRMDEPLLWRYWKGSATSVPVWRCGRRSTVNTLRN